MAFNLSFLSKNNTSGIQTLKTSNKIIKRLDFLAKQKTLALINFSLLFASVFFNLFFDLHLFPFAFFF